MSVQPLLHRMVVRRIAVLRALQLGDLLCAVPALRALRGAVPAAEITLLGLPWARTFVERFHAYVDGFLEFPGFPGLPEREPQIEAFPRFLDEAQRRRFDLVIQMHGSGGVTNHIAALIGPQQTAGYYVPGAYCPAGGSFLPFPEDEHEVRRQIRLMEFLGAPSCGEHLEFPITNADQADLDTVVEAQSLGPGAYACVHPGARHPSRRWPAERFAAVADGLAARGLGIVLTGSAEERVLTSAVHRAMRAPAIDLAGRTTLGALGVLIKRARLVVCNDTGVSHVAAALGTRSVVIASGSDVVRWAPLGHDRHRVLWHDLDCRPCGHVECPIGHPCALAIDLSQVLAEADELLAQEWPAVATAGEGPAAAGGVIDGG